MVLSAQELYERGVSLANRGRFTAAERTLGRAAAQTHDDDLRARIDGTTAYALTRTGRPQEAELLCESALARRGLSARTKALLYGQLGAICAHAGRLDEAEAWLARGIAGLADEPVAGANLRVNRSIVNMQRRALDAAVADLDEAIRAYAADGLTEAEAQARHNLGYVSMLAGDLVAALRAMAEAKRILGTGSAFEAAIGDVDRAEVLLDAGLPGEAEQILAEAARVFGTHRARQARADAQVALARSQLTHDPVAAAATAARAARTYRALGNGTGAARADAVGVRARLAAGVVNTRGEPVRAAAKPPAHEEVEAAASALEERRLRADAAAVRLAAELRRARRGESAGGRVRVPRGAGIDVQLLAYEVRVARADASGSEAVLRRHAAAGIDALGAWRQAFGSLDLQASVSMHAQPLMIAGVKSALRSRRPEVVFEWSERARHLSQQVVPLRPPPDTDAAAELAELRMLRADDPGGDWLASPRAAELRDHARERQWASVGVAQRQERATLDELRAALGDDTALLSYLWADDTLACLVATREGARLCELPGWPSVRRALSGLRADLDVSAAVRTGPMADVIRRSLDARLAVLSAQLLDGPLAAAKGSRRIVATAPGVLSGLPWGMLPALHGRPFTLAVSATRWLSLRDGASAAPTTAGIVVGPRVARGEEEADAVAAAWTRRGTDLRGADATVDAVTSLAGDVSVLHIAAHGRHTADNPLFSGLELADGALFGYDIDRMPRLPATVVLSACEVGRSSVRWGEEALGMTRTWLHAGSRCVIAAPVIVADDVACELLGAVHTGLAAGEAPAEALAAASVSTGLVAPFECHGSGF